MTENPETKPRKRYTNSGVSMDRLAEQGLIKKPARRARRGWGPFKSVVKERSVAFNLTLDVQNIRQEIEDMLVARELLRSRAVMQRHDPAGSLAQVVRTHYQVFQQGYVVPDATRRFAMAEWQQRVFLRDVVDDDIELGNGLVGAENMAEQIKIYSIFLRFLKLSLDQLKITVADESVVIATRGRMQFEIKPQTILGIFPHVASNERIMARLVGQVVETPCTITFYFNAESKMDKYEVDMDFVSTFMAVLKDPADVAVLLGRALIADNCMFGVMEESAEDAPDDLAADPETRARTQGKSDRDGATASAVEPLAEPTANEDTAGRMSMDFILG